MEIKLKAKLAAYSKIDSIDILDSRVPHSAIDTLFTKNTDTAITEKDIDTLFSTEEPDIIISSEKIDTLFDNNEPSTKVTYADIDKLFS